jgi:2-dehydropantoate 2-reductase
MKIAIFGTGGVGGYFGGRLAKAGEDVTFIARGKHLDALLKSGLQVASVYGDFTIQPVKATNITESVGLVDVVILGVKAWQLDSAIEQIRPLIGQHTIILPLLNGIEHIDTLTKAFGEQHIVGGLCRISVFIEGAGHIRHKGVPPYIAFGELDNTRTKRIEALYQTFSGLEHISTEIPANIQLAMWEKYVFISSTSGVGAIMRVPINEYRHQPEPRAMLINAMKETISIAKAKGIFLAETFIDETMQRIDSAPEGMIPSMQKDITEGRPSELDAQIGAAIRMGLEVNISTPVHEKIYARLLPFEQKARDSK